MREFSVSIGTAESFWGNAWILTPSQRPDLQGHWFAAGTRIEIAASPAPGHFFTHWTFNNLSTGNITTDTREVMAFTIHGNTIVLAHFSSRSHVHPVPPIGRPPIAPPPRHPHPPRPPHPPHPHPPRPPIGTPPSHRPAVTPAPPTPPHHLPSNPRPPIGRPSSTLHHQ